MRLLSSLSGKVLLALLSLFLVAGCGDSSEDSTATQQPGEQPSGGRQAHVNWNSYNLYQFQNGTWTQLIARGELVGALPALGERPVVIVHGLGSEIFNNRFNALATGMQQSGATAIFGFEYDSLDSVAKNGGFFLDAMSLLAEQTPGTTWRIAAHSMGALVVRSALESQVPLNVAPTGNRAVLIAGPHTGSEVVEQLQDRNDLLGEALGDLVINGRLEFRNVDRSPVAVSGTEQGFTDLRRDSGFLANLNFEAANKHPQFAYLTLAGDARSTDYETLNRVMGVFADDGLVNVDSANAPVIGAINSAVLDFDHSAIVESLDPVVAILSFLGF